MNENVVQLEDRHFVKGILTLADARCLIVSGRAVEADKGDLPGNIQPLFPQPPGEKVAPDMQKAGGQVAAHPADDALVVLGLAFIVLVVQRVGRAGGTARKLITGDRSMEGADPVCLVGMAETLGQQQAEIAVASLPGMFNRKMHRNVGMTAQVYPMRLLYICIPAEQSDLHLFQLLVADKPLQGFLGNHCPDTPRLGLHICSTLCEVPGMLRVWIRN